MKSSRKRGEASQRFSDILKPSSKTLERYSEIANNTVKNLLQQPKLRIRLPSISALKKQTWPTHVLIVARGPSLFQNPPFETILQARKAGHDFAIFSADGSIASCLSAGIVPNLSASIDPSPRVLRWFGDTRNVTATDEYFLRDRDAPRNKKALYNRGKTISLLGEHGSDLNVAIGVYTHEYVLDRLMEIGANVYQFFPASDDEQYMKQMWHEYPNLVGLNCGGNVGTTCFNLARYLGFQHIGLYAFDMGYPAQTPLEETQFYDLVAKYRRHNRKGKPTRKYMHFAKEFFTSIKNPYGQKWFTDKVYELYAYQLLQMIENAANSGITVTNTSRAGIVFSDHVKRSTLTEFLKNTPTDLC